MSAKKSKSKKQSKRSNNDGCIRRRSDGRWEAIYTVRYDSNDQPVRRSVYGKTRGEVTLKLREILQQIAMEEYGCLLTLATSHPVTDVVHQLVATAFDHLPAFVDAPDLDKEYEKSRCSSCNCTTASLA